MVWPAQKSGQGRDQCGLVWLWQFSLMKLDPAVGENLGGMRDRKPRLEEGQEKRGVRNKWREEEANRQSKRSNGGPMGRPQDKEMLSCLSGADNRALISVDCLEPWLSRLHLGID